jgi:hypothetical protein
MKFSNRLEADLRPEDAFRRCKESLDLPGPDAGSAADCYTAPRAPEAANLY